MMRSLAFPPATILHDGRPACTQVCTPRYGGVGNRVFDEEPQRPVVVFAVQIAA